MRASFSGFDRFIWKCLLYEQFLCVHVYFYLYPQYIKSFTIIWHIYQWHFYHLAFLPLAILLSGIFTTGIFTICHIYHWHFYHLAYLPLAILPSGIFTTGNFTIWHIYQWHFYHLAYLPIAFLPMAILPMAFLPMTFLLHTGDVLLGREFKKSVIWYITCADWWLTTTTYAYVALPPNFRQVWGYPNKSGQNIKFVLFFTGNISFHVLDISKLKKIWWWWVSWEGGGVVHGDRSMDEYVYFKTLQ